MAGGLLQLVSTGSNDAPLIFNPEITFFKLVYRKYTNFAIQQTVKNLGTKNFNTFNSYKIDKTGDLLQGLYFKINIPKFNIIKKNIQTTNNTILNINTLQINYNNHDSFLFFFNNNFYIIPKYIIKLFNFNYQKIIVNNLSIITNLLPDIINNNNINYSYIYDLQENNINPIFTLLSKYNNFFENFYQTLLLSSSDYEYNNQLITTFSYLNKLNNGLAKRFYNFYNYYNNFRNNKKYYNFTEIQQYLNYQQNNIITLNNFDVDVIYNYCIINNINNYLVYQTNSILYNSIFIYNILLQLYPINNNIFTFWKKYNLLTSNQANTNFFVNNFNYFDEWRTNLANTFNSQLLNNLLIIVDDYKRNYLITENNINQLFSQLVINNPENLFIILSTFINQYDSTTRMINFDDYNSKLNTNLLSNKINQQLNNYNTLNNTNAEIYAIPNIIKYLTIYPVDLTVIYSYLAYKLVDSLYNSQYFDNNYFLIYWRNKINNFFFINYIDNIDINKNNSELYDIRDLNRKLTFFVNFNLKTFLSLQNIKQYFINLFYSSSFFGSINMSNIQYNNFLLNTNYIDFTQLQINGTFISLTDNIKQYNKLKIITKYNITKFNIIDNYIININDWNNTNNNLSIFIIIINNINYIATKFIFNNFILTLYFDYLPNNITNFILQETHLIDIPLISFNISTPLNNVYIVNLFSKNNNIVINDNILSDTHFYLDNLVININKNTITNYFFYYFKIININIDNNIYRFLIDIIDNNGQYIIKSDNQKLYNKTNILNIDIEFINVIYRDIATKDANTIVNNTFIISNRNDWTYDDNKTYWLYYNNKYIPLRYYNGSFIVNDLLEPVIYTIREITNTQIPSLFNYINHVDNPNNISDLTDFMFQTPMIITTLLPLPYIYFYGLPFKINNTTDIYINNYQITNILPLNPNQFFDKKISPLFHTEILAKQITHFDLVKFVSSQFDNIYLQPNYVNIINTIEQSRQLLLNLNTNYLSNYNLYGSTTNTIISNINKINNGITNYNNYDFNKYNKLVLDIYGNNKIVANNVIQGLTTIIFNYPIMTYLPNNKITNDLIYYLNNIPIYFQEQITYNNNNLDYIKILNPVEYNNKFDSLGTIQNDILNIAFDNDNNFIIELLYPIDNLNFDSLYNDNHKIDISKIINNKLLLAKNYKNISNDNNYTTDILSTIENEFTHYKFNYLGPVYFDNAKIYFNNFIDISNYKFIKLDNNIIYPIDEFINDSTNIIYKYSYLCNIYDTSNNYILQKSNLIYYYKVIITNDISNNILFTNNSFYYINHLQYNEYEIISFYSFNINKNDYFCGSYYLNNINDLLIINFYNLTNLHIIYLDNCNLIEHYKFNYFCDYEMIIINTQIKQILTKYYIYMDIDSPTINQKIYEFYKLPPFQVIDKNLFSFNKNERIFLEHSNNNYIKLDHYILNINNLTENMLITNNYDLSILPKKNVNLIKYDITGNISINNNIITIIFDFLSSMPNNSYYLINNTFIYISEFNFILNIDDINVNYYNYGNFTEIYLLDNTYFNHKFPLIGNYENIYGYENLTGQIYYDISFSNIVNEIKNRNYVINNHHIYSYDDSTINIDSTDEKIIELALNDLSNNILYRPIIIKNKILSIYPSVSFIWIYSNKVYNNSFIILETIPNNNVTFATLNIIFNGTPITSIQPLQPNITIYSNNNNTNNSVSFNNNISLQYNVLYKWKLLINNIYPVYFWTTFTQKNFIYTNDNISEPIYVNNIYNYIIKLNDNINLLGNIPNIIKNTNNILTLNNYFINKQWILSSKYYINNILNDKTNYKILNYNYNINDKYVPDLLLMDINNIISFNDNFINLESIEIINNITFLIIQNNNYIYTKVNTIMNNGIYIDNKLDNNYPINIYYSYSNLHFRLNNLIMIQDDNLLYIYYIIKYSFNDLDNNEIIKIDESIFLVLGINIVTNYYELKLLNNNFLNINKKINGYYSLGICNKKPLFIPPIIKYKEPIIYFIDNYSLDFGDYYLKNDIIKINLSNEFVYDIFAYNKKQEKINIYVNNNHFYILDEFIILKQKDILIYNGHIYHIKSIQNYELFFTETIILQNGFYIFNYPYQPFNNLLINITNNGNVINLTNEIIINKYDFIELDYVIYKINNIPNTFYNKTIFTRIINIQENIMFFDNPLYLDKYITNVYLDNSTVIYSHGYIIDQYTVDFNNKNILNIYFYYYQPIKIGSCINFITSVLYRDTTIIISLVNPLYILTNNVDIYISPLKLCDTKYYSIYEINNFKSPLIDISNNLFIYNINTNLIKIDTNLNNIIPNEYTQLIFIDNYTQIDKYYNVINSTLHINSYHLLLEITTTNDYFIHLIKIIYPNNLYIYTNILQHNSEFYLDKIYKIKINFIDYSFCFISTTYYKKTQLLYKINSIDLWYKYNIQTKGVPIYDNNIFKLEILNANIYLDQDIYLEPNTNVTFKIIANNDKFYLISNIYLGNNINYIYLKNINYIKSSLLNNLYFKEFYNNHSDLSLLKYIKPLDYINEKIVNKTIITLDTIGSQYKYKLYTFDNSIYDLDSTKLYTIGDPFLNIVETYNYNGITFIFTDNFIPNIENNKTQIYNNVKIYTNSFNQLSLFKTVPEITSKLSLNTFLKSFMIINNIKPWYNWTIISSIYLNNVTNLLYKGNIIFNGNTIIHDNTNIYFTNEENTYFSNLLLFIYDKPNEINKLNIQNNLLNIILSQLDLWIVDTTFWNNVKLRINNLLIDLQINAIFNGSCLVFSDETQITTHFDITNPNKIKRKYILNNQYTLINNNKITRNMNTIFTQTELLINNQTNDILFGLEVNELLVTLYEYGEQYKTIMNNIYYNNDKIYDYFNCIKLFINYVWGNYKNQFNHINKNFNEYIDIQNNITNFKTINYFTNDFRYLTTDTFNDITGYFIKDMYSYNNFFFRLNNTYTLKTNAIYEYYISFDKTIIIPEVIYKLQFYDVNYNNILFNTQKYPVEIEFYHENDIDSNTQYSLIGLTNYNVISTYLGKIYKISTNYINPIYIDNVYYKQNEINIYTFDISSISFTSTIPIINNNYLEIYKNVGLKYQVDNYLFFYQNNFNYIINDTYIKFNNIYYPLNIDSSSNFFLNTILLLPSTVSIIILYNINTVFFENNYVYSLELDNKFLNYHQYIQYPHNIIPINFKLNDNYIPEEIIFNSENIIIVKTNDLININKLSHYANIGETPALELKYLIKNDKYLYFTDDIFKIQNNSTIWISDTSNYSFGINGSQEQLKNNNYFLLPQSLSLYELTYKSLYIVSKWTIDKYIYDPLNNNIIFNYPNNLIFNCNTNYNYLFNDNYVNITDLYINKNQLVIKNIINISGSFSFTQIYKSPYPIKKPLLNQVAQIKLIEPIQYFNDIYMIPFDNNGNNIGSKLYIINLSTFCNDLHVNNAILIIDVLYDIDILLWINNYTLIFSINNELDLNKNFKIELNSIIYNITYINYYQESYQQCTFYYQDDINYFYVFVNENINSIDFTDQKLINRYYVHSIIYSVHVQNLFNPRLITKSHKMDTTIISTNTINTIIEIPKININKIFKNISFYLGDQLVETLNEDVYNIIYNFYAQQNKKIQLDKIFKIISNDQYWEIYFPLLFWFNYYSTLSLPLVALPYTDLYIKYDINSLTDILENNLINCSFSINPEINLEIVLDTVLLDTKERLLFSSNIHEYIIERFIIYPTCLIYNDTQTINLNYSNLVKSIFWISKPLYHNTQTSYNIVTNIYDNRYKYYIELMTAYNQYKITNIITSDIALFLNDFVLIDNINNEILINNSSRINYIKNDIFFYKYELHFILFLMDKYFKQLSNLKLYLSNIYTNKQKINYISPIQTINIQSNGVDIVPQYEYNYFNSVIPYQKFHNSPPIGYYTYSFALNSYEQQPSGHLNFTHLENVFLKLTNNISSNNNEPFNLINIVKEYQILRIMSGQGALGWLN